MRNRPMLPAAIVLALLLATISCANRTREPASYQAPASGEPVRAGETSGGADSSGLPAKTNRALAVLGGSPYRGKTIYLVGDRPVTEEELLRYQAKVLSGPTMKGHGQDFAPEKIIRSFAIYWNTAEQGVEAGLFEDPFVRGVLDVHRKLALANDYRAHLEKVVVPSAEEIRSLIPTEWVRIDFSVRNFPSKEEAERFYGEAMDKRKDLGKEEFRKFVGENFSSATGPVFRGSGFFDPFDDRYLFTLKEGEVSRPVSTGIGPGVCFVRMRDDMGRKEIDDYLNTERSKIVSREVEKGIAKIVGSLDYSIAQDNVDRSARMEGDTGRISNLVVLTVGRPGGEVRVRYNDLRTLVPTNFRPIFSTYPRESWRNIVEGDIENVAAAYAVGSRAETEGIPIQPKWEKALFDFKVEVLYRAELDRLARASSVKVTDGEVERFYRVNRGYYTRDENILCSYFFSPEREGLKTLVEQSGGKEELFSAKANRHLMKSRRITAGDDVFGEVYRRIEALKPGEISGIVSGKMGFYVLRVDERTEKGFAPFAEVKNLIRESLLEEKRREKALETIRERMKSVEVRHVEKGRLDSPPATVVGKGARIRERE